MANPAAVAVVAQVLSQHHARPAIMASPGAARYGEGYHASCSCGWKGPAKGKHTNREEANANREAAQQDAFGHMASEILKAA